MSSYHYGDLRRAVLDQALRTVGERGPASLSLRAIAADLGVSHTAPRHHFGSNSGLLTAIAAEGFGLLGARLAALRAEGAPFLDLGVAYVEFAVTHPAHFAVMFQPKLLDLDDETYLSASAATFAELRAGVAGLAAAGDAGDAATAVTAAWSLMHGLATLELTGNLERSDIRGLLGASDISEIARRAGSMLSGSHRGAE